MGYKAWTSVEQNDISFLKDMGLKPGHKFLDVGCGGGRLGRSLIEYLDASNYYAFDKEEKYISPFLTAVSSSKKHLDKNPVILKSDFNTLDFDDSIKFEFVYAYSVFTHLDPASIGIFLSKLSKNFTTGSIFATVCFAPKGREVETYEIMGGKHERPGEFVEVFYNKTHFQSLLGSVGYRFVNIDNFSGYIGPGYARVNMKDKPKYFGNWANLGSFQQMVRIVKI